MGRGITYPAVRESASEHTSAAERTFHHMPTRLRPDPLQAIPGIGPSLARDLRALNVRTVADLKGRFAGTPRPRPPLLKWWNWTDDRMPAR